MDEKSEGRAVYKRKGVRFNYQHDCTLIHNGQRFACRTDNISLTGALISAKDPLPQGLRPGDTCGLSLCSDTSEVSGETSKIVRMDSSSVALNFLGFNY